MMNMKDDWVAAALSDDTLVADLLSRLNQSSSQPPKPPPSASLSLPLGWGHRQPRSKPKKDSATTTTTRCSPTTPLSWSGGGGGGAASPSDGDYSNSNSSRPSSDLSRSKVAYANDVTNIYANKRSKKKTFSELKEEESLLLKERVTLKRELASLHVTLKEQRVRSENLKRIKIDLNIHTAGETCKTSTSDQTEVAAFPNGANQMEASTSDHTHSALPRHAAHEGFGSSDSCGVQKESDMQKGCFALPDLNMMPSEEDIDPEMVNGIS